MLERPRLLVSLAHRPFGMGLAVLAFLSGLYGLIGANLATDALSGLVPGWLEDVLNATFMLAGAALLAGMAWHRGNVEAAGCVLMIAGVVVRGFAFVVHFGLSRPTVGALILYASVAIACALRLWQITHHISIVAVRRG